MARKGGNPNFSGGPGSGRKPIKKEMKELFWILERWQDKKKVAELIKRKEKGDSLSLREVYVLRAFNGSDAVLNKLSDKILPDKVEWNNITEDEKGDLKDALEYARWKINKALGKHKSSEDS